jgi:outer membrane lipoprotein SlyB
MKMMMIAALIALGLAGCAQDSYSRARDQLGGNAEPYRGINKRAP